MFFTSIKWSLQGYPLVEETSNPFRGYPKIQTHVELYKMLKIVQTERRIPKLGYFHCISGGIQFKKSISSQSNISKSPSKHWLVERGIPHPWIVIIPKIWVRQNPYIFIVGDIPHERQPLWNQDKTLHVLRRQSFMNHPSSGLYTYLLYILISYPRCSWFNPIFPRFQWSFSILMMNSWTAPNVHNYQHCQCSSRPALQPSLGPGATIRWHSPAVVASAVAPAMALTGFGVRAPGSGKRIQMRSCLG